MPALQFSKSVARSWPDWKLALLFFVCLFSVGLFFQQCHLASMRKTTLCSRHYFCCWLNFTDGQSGNSIRFESNHIRRMLPIPVKTSWLLRRRVGIGTCLWLTWISPWELPFIFIYSQKRWEQAAQTYTINSENPLSLGWQMNRQWGGTSLFSQYSALFCFLITLQILFVGSICPHLF